MKPYVFLLCCAAGTAGAADVYRWVDDDGNVVFSDQPHPGAEVIKLPEIQTIESQSPPSAPTLPAPAPADAAFAGYDSIVITSPENEATIRDNQGTLVVSTLTKPELQTSLGHKLVLYLDGKPVSEGGSAGVVNLENVDRGSHILQAVALDGEGSEIGRSDTTVVHLKRHSVNFPTGPGNAGGSQ